MGICMCFQVGANEWAVRGVRMDAIGSRAAEVADVWPEGKANVKLTTIIATIRRFDEWGIACLL